MGTAKRNSHTEEKYLKQAWEETSGREKNRKYPSFRGKTFPWCNIKFYLFTKGFSVDKKKVGGFNTCFAFSFYIISNANYNFENLPLFSLKVEQYNLIEREGSP